MIQENPKPKNSTNFQKFDNVYAPKSCGKFTNLESAINYIRGENRGDIEVVNNLRALSKGTPQSDSIKRSLPAVLWNFNTTGCRNKTCATTSTGYFYFDIDDKEFYDFTPDYFCAYWKSITNTGYGALVQVSGVDAQNYNDAYKEVAESLNIPFDKNARDMVRLNIISYDPNVFYNPKSQIFDFSHFSDRVDVDEEISEKCQTADQNTFLKSSDYNDTFMKLRYDNLEEMKSTLSLIYDSNGVCDLKDDKISYTQIYMPKNIPDGKRYETLSRIAIQLVTLNPFIKIAHLQSFMRSVNQTQCTPPMYLSKLQSLCKKVMERKDSYVLISNKTRRFFFDVELHIADKRSLVLSYIKKDISVRKKAQILAALRDLAELGKPFKVVDIIRQTKVVRNTINKYLNEIILENPELNLTMLTTKNIIKN